MENQGLYGYKFSWLNDSLKTESGNISDGTYTVRYYKSGKVVSLVFYMFAVPIPSNAVTIGQLSSGFRPPVDMRLVNYNANGVIMTASQNGNVGLLVSGSPGSGNTNILGTLTYVVS